MISFHKTINGRIAPIEIAEDNCWINVVAPTDTEIEQLVNDYGIEPEFFRASLDEEESSHIDSEDGHTLIIIDVPISEKPDDNLIYYTMPIGIIFVEKHIITVSLKDNPVIQEFSDGVVRNVQTNLKTQFVLHIFYRIANRYLQYLKQIDKISSFVETELRKSMRNKELTQLMDLEKSLVYFSTSLKSNEVTLEKILRGRFIKLYDEDQDLLEDVLIEVKQAIEMANIYLSILSGTMDAFASVISNNLNIVMKVLTSITILMSVPTLIFSFYGMNVDLPGNHLGIIFPIGLSVIITAIAGVLLHKKDML